MNRRPSSVVRFFSRRQSQKRNRQASRRQVLAYELLEPRRLLASDWTNPNRPGDVDGNGFAFPLDALVVLNQLASNQRLGLGSSLPDLDDQQPPPYFDVNGDNTITPLDALLVLNIIAKSPAVPEVLSVALQADTGPFGSLNSDQITSRAVIVGRAIDPDNPLASVEARVNDGAFQPITFDSLGQFVFETGLLLDGTNDGIHSVAIRATDQTNRVSPQTEFSFTLDTTAPQSPTLELAPAFVLGSPQNQQTSNDVVTLRGITSPGARLRLGTGSAEITAAGDGRFEFTSVPLSLGVNTLTVIASDLAGNLAETTVTITRIADRVGPEMNINGPLTRLTNANITVSGTIGESATLLFGQIDLGDVFEIPITGGTFTFNTTLPTNGNADGQHLVRLRAEDARGNQSPLATVVWTLDTVAPVASTDFTGTVRSQSSLLPIVFNEPLAPSSLVAASYTLSITSGPRAGQTIAIQSVRQEAGNRVVLVLPQAMENVSHRLQLGSGVLDAAGNRPSTTVFDFTVAQPTRLRESSPANGEEMVSLTRETIIRFDNEVDPATITPESFYLIANGERVAGRIRVSATERFATFFYDNPLPASTGVRIMVDGNLIRGRDGLPLDADNDGEPGGILQADFRTLPLTFIPGTSVWGYVYDSYNTVPQERSPIAVPTGDPQFDPNSTGTATISFARAEFFPTTGQSTSDPRLQPNKISSVIDANVVYGSDELRARALRRIDGSGKLKTTVDNLLPLNNATFFPNGELPVDNKGTFANSSLPVAGDIRAAASPALAVVHTLFVREHNRKADEIKAANPKFSDELIYQEARRWVSALIQQITYQEYLPSLVGPNSLAMYTGYKPNIDPSVGALFSTAAFRLGHTQQGSVVPRLDANGQAWPDGDLGLREAFFNPTPVEADGIDPFLRGLIANQAQEIDLKVVDDLRNFLFGAPGPGGMDLAAINIERGRDLGLPSYNQAREDFGLTKVTTFAQITSNAQVAAALTSLYGSVDQLDVWVGGLAENHVTGGAVGPLFAAIIKDQFLRSRDGDRFWYENSQLSQADLTTIRGTTLSDVIERNSGLTGVAANVFTTATAPAGPAAGGSAATRAPSEFPTYDGYGNNVANPLQGRAGQPLLTSTTIGYSDGQSSPAGADRPGTRSISNALFAQPAPTLNTRGLTELSVTWGQFIAHDFSLTPAQSTKGTDIPVVGATIFLDADASVFATTDQFGFFELTTPAGMPAPDFFVHIDGSTAVNAPADAKYATLGKPFHSIPGQRIQLKMAGTPFDVYLPPMSMSDIVTLNPTTDTEVGFGPAAQAEIRAMFADDPAKAQLIIDTMRVTYPAGSAQSESGVPATRATIIPVSPDRLPAPLPPGANPGLVISVQAGTDAGFNLAGGSTNFDVPAPISFPNLEALSPGEVTLLWSFDHDAGDWVVAGTATVQPNRDSVMSDNGNGILAPGWHFIERGVRVRANPFVEDPDENDKCDPTSQALKALALQAVAGAFSGLPGTGSYATDHLFDFLNGNGSPKLYGPNSGPATDIQGTPAFQREAAKLLDGLASAIAANNGQNGFPTSIPDYSTTTSSMGFYPFGNFPGTQASAAIGGVGPAGVQVSNININPDGTFTADVEYAIKDRYSFSDDRGKSLFDNYANDLELCGFASPFDVDVKIRQSISGQATSGQTAPEGEDGDNSLNISLATAYATNRIFEFDGSKLSISTSGVGEFEFQSRNATGPQFASISLGSSPSPFFRSSTSSTGSGLQEVVLRENTSYTLRVLNLRNQYNGEVSFNTGTGGTILTLGKIKISPDLQRIDTDGDGLSDFAETVVGTNSRSADSDGDGLSDFAELEQGLSPLSGLSFPTGVIASISVMGETKESVVAVSGASRIGYIATGSHGLAITDLTNTDQPIMLGQLSLQGDSQDIDVDSLTSTAIVASGEGGLHFVDVSDPMLPRHVRTVNINATQVQLLDGVAYASSGSRISAYDPSSGDLLSAYSIPDSGLITGLAHEGNFIYAIDAVLKLHVLEVGRFQVLKRGNVQLPQGGSKLSVNNGIVYVGAQPSYLSGGFVTVDVSNPANPELISGSDVGSAFITPGLAVVPNGSGLGLAIGRVGASGNRPVVGIVDVTDPQVTDNYLTQFDLPALPQSVTIASGIGYVASGTGGLVVVNYVPFDNRGTAPIVTATGPTGTTVQEGSFVSIRTAVTDDVQVRDVELLMNGTVVARDVSAPFDLRAVTPGLTDAESTVTFQVRATDTGGNVGLSSVLTYTLTPDITPPTIINSTPSDNGAGFRVNAITLRFDEPIDSTRLSVIGFTLTNLGNDFRVGGGDDTTVAIDRIQALSPTRIVVYPSSPLPEGTFRLTGDASVIADVAGNEVTTAVGITFTSFDLDEANSIAWNTDSDGNWNDAGNWNTGEVPGPNDAVIIDRKTASPTITISSGNVSVRSLLTREPFVLSGGALNLAQTSAFDGGLSISAGATLTATGSSTVVVSNGATSLDGARLFAANGAKILLSQVFDASNSPGNLLWRATGVGSVIDLPNLTVLTQSTGIRTSMGIEALAGGRVNLPRLTQYVDQGSDLRGKTLNLKSDGLNSVIDLSSLSQLNDASSADWQDCCGGFTEGMSTIVTSNAGAITIPLLASVSGFELRIKADTGYAFAGITRLVDSNLFVTGVPVTFPVLTDARSTRITAENRGEVTLPEVLDADGVFLTTSQGKISLPKVTQFANTSGGGLWRASGDGSVIDLPKLTVLTQSTGIRTSMGIEALAGGRVNLPKLTQYVDPGSDLRGKTLNLKSDGLNSVIDLSSMSALLDNSSADWQDCCGGFTEGMSTIITSNAGAITIPLLASVSGFELRIKADTGYAFAGITRLVDGNLFVTEIPVTFPVLTGAQSTQIFVTGVPATFPVLTDARSTRITADNRGEVTLPEVLDADGASLIASQGKISLPKVTQFANTSGGGLWRASGDGSVIDLPKLTVLTQSTGIRTSMGIEALAGGRVNLPKLTQYVDPGSDLRGKTLNLKSDGLNSVIDLSSLSALLDNSAADWQDCCGGFTEGMSTIVSSNSGRVVFAGSSTNTTNFMLLLGTNGGLDGNVELGSGSELRGTGTVQGKLQNNATVNPGDSIGGIRINGDFEQSTLGKTFIELGGRTATTGYDNVVVSGVASLAGGLTVNLINGFSPNVGDVFRVLTYSSRVGEFELITGLDIGNGKVLLPTYSSTGLTLQTAAALAADSFGSGYVAGELSEASVYELAIAAANQWSLSDATTELQSRLRPIIVIQDLPGLTLAAAIDNVLYLDHDAAGWGWFIDQTPGRDEEFSVTENPFELDNDSERIDLLTVLSHEIGHLLGLDHTDDADELSGTLMRESLSNGTRRKVSSELIDKVLLLWN